MENYIERIPVETLLREARFICNAIDNCLDKSMAATIEEEEKVS